ncbi:MAG: helicase, superfamily [Actinomycetia bacterium]|nr:helicase, superfamily [Actinomycetes bacterium]
MTTGPRVDPEIEAEQAYVDNAYARLEAMRVAAKRVREAYADVRQGGTHQARLERDIAYDVTHRRLAELEIGDSPLVFGRLDLDEAGPYYIGRFAVEDAAHTPLVVDWRAPVAEPFYRATAVVPMGVVRRRHFLTRKGREIMTLDDEVFDPDAIAAAGLKVSGEGALLAALEQNRTGRMHDIVATIQSEQDEAIRADMHGVLVVAGGPGTGKTAVALHRAAYLLYTHRARLASQGVLLVGPSKVFLRYIEQVLPSLGEQDVQLSTITGLKPRLRASATDSVAVATMKGDARMADVIWRAVADRERALPRELTLVLDGLRIRVSRQDTARIADAARRRRGTHNSKWPYAQRRLLDLLAERYKAAAIRSYHGSRLDAPGRERVRPLIAPPSIAGTLARGETPPEGWETELRGRFRRLPEVREALDRMWPVLSGAELVNDLLGFRALVRSAGRGILDEREQDLLHRRRVSDLTQVPWTDADVALVDEADTLLGPVEAAQPRRARRRVSADDLETASRVIAELGLAGTTDAAQLAARFSDPSVASNGDGTGEPRVFGHVLVDEAQDLTAMQWRMLSRRCPSGSMTLVGDPGQASRPGAVSSWDDVFRHLPTHNPPRFATLSVNYRTPSEIMEVAARLLSVAAPTVEPSQSVRSTGESPRYESVAREDLVATAASSARAALNQGGTVALIAPAAVHEALVLALADVGAVADSAEALDAPITVLDATDAKGLEFDHVIVTEPARLVTPDRAGLRLLYVTITRATKTLTIVHSEPLPEGLR